MPKILACFGYHAGMQPIVTTTAIETNPRQRVEAALAQRRFFKLIGGGSLTDAHKIAQLLEVYAHTGMVDCVDVAPEPEVIAAIERVYENLPASVYRPLVMVSIPLDPDLHFRKIDLIEPQCIVCDACVPVCPTEAIATVNQAINITEPLCYGCGRCVAVCPTEALVLHPFLQKEQIANVLGQSLVQAVEIHTQFLDSYMLDDFLKQYGALLQDKLIALCFRPENKDWIAFCRNLKARLPGFQILQIDGQPMSGSEDPAASLPSLAAARFVNAQLPADLADLHVTISGGINAQTAEYLNAPEHGFIAGVGMGTVARQAVWPYLSDHSAQAVLKATQLARAFKNARDRL